MIKVNDIVKVNRIDWVNNRHVNKIKCGDVCVVYSITPVSDSKYRYILIVPESSFSVTSVCMEGDLSVCNNYEDKEKLLEIAKPLIRYKNSLNKKMFKKHIERIMEIIELYKNTKPTKEGLVKLSEMVKKINSYPYEMTEEMIELRKELNVVYNNTQFN